VGVVRTHSCNGTPHECGAEAEAYRGNWRHHIGCSLDCGHDGPHKGEFTWDY